MEYTGIREQITHGNTRASYACRYYGALIVAATQEYNKGSFRMASFIPNIGLGSEREQFNQMLSPSLTILTRSLRGMMMEFEERTTFFYHWKLRSGDFGQRVVSSRVPSLLSTETGIQAWLQQATTTLVRSTLWQRVSLETT